MDYAEDLVKAGYTGSDSDEGLDPTDTGTRDSDSSSVDSEDAIMTEFLSTPEFVEGVKSARSDASAAAQASIKQDLSLDKTNHHKVMVDAAYKAKQIIDNKLEPIYKAYKAQVSAGRVYQPSPTQIDALDP
jgi:hypothetical protein